jgi:spore germination cell wall hydrolase CwlJ-like protein
MQFDDLDVSTVGLCVWKEARGEGQLGMKAVLDVIVNRAKGWGKTLHDVVYQKNQFTSMSVPSDPEFNLEPAAGDEQYQFCLDTTRQTLETGMGDITFGSLYYANLKNVTSGWFVDNISGPDCHGTASHPFKTKIGSQSFFG